MVAVPSALLVTVLLLLLLIVALEPPPSTLDVEPSAMLSMAGAEVVVPTEEKLPPSIGVVVFDGDHMTEAVPSVTVSSGPCCPTGPTSPEGATSSAPTSVTLRLLPSPKCFFPAIAVGWRKLRLAPARLLRRPSRFHYCSASCLGS